MEQFIRPHVFVCHNRQDKPAAERIATAMLLAGHEAFFDKWDIKPGDFLIEKIAEGISDSSYLLVLLSKNSVKSEGQVRIGNRPCAPDQIQTHKGNPLLA